MLTRPNLFIALLAAALALAMLYAPQPLLPVIAAHFSVSETAAAALITWSLLVMSVAPLLVGVLLQVLAPHRVIAWSLVGLALTEGLFFGIQRFAWWEVLRLLQGALVAALLAALMTYLAATAKRLQQVMAYYVAALVLGGLLGRLSAGLVASLTEWTYVFAGMSLALAACALCAFRLPPAAAYTPSRVRLAALWEVAGTPLFAYLYGVIFAGFCALMALLNFIPFRLKQLDETLGESTIALSYIGFLFGLGASLMAPRLSRLLGGPLRAVGAGLLLLVVALLVAWLPAVAAVYASVFVSTAGFFLAHAVLSSFVNARARPDISGVVNSLYVAVYYAGGSFGSYVPGLLYARAGWTVFIVALMGLLGAGLLLLILAGRAPAPVDRAPAEK